MRGLKRLGRVAVFAVVVVVIVLAGCGSGDEADTSTDASPTTATIDASTTTAPTSTSVADEAEPTSTSTQSTVVEAEAPVFTPGEVMERQLGERTYLLYAASGFDQSTPAALVLDLHGLGETAWTSLGRTMPLADETGAVFAYPEANPVGEAGEQMGLHPRDLRWDMESDIDATFVGRVLDDIESFLDIDPERIYAIGHSNGGELATFLPCHLGSRLSGVVTNAALAHHDQQACGSNEPIDVLAIIGEFDNHTNIGEPYLRENYGDFGSYPGPWTDEITHWAETNSCESAYAETTDHGTLHRVYTCEDARLEVHRFRGTHVWAGTGPAHFAVGDFEANDVLWNFLEPTAP